MFKNYFKTALRNFWRTKIFSAINILGLTIGISASLVIYLIVNHDFSFDKFEQNGDRIYRVVSDVNFSGQSYNSSGVPQAMPLAVKNETTGLDVVAPFRTWNNGVKVNIPSGKNVSGKMFKKEKNIVFVDENYFKLLQYTWVTGSPKTSFLQPYQTVLTEKNAERYFPGLANDQIVGKEIVFNDTIRTIVTGLVKDLNSNTDFTFKTFISRATIETPRLQPKDGDHWSSTNSASQLFIKLSSGTTAIQIQDQIASIFKKYYKPTQQTTNIKITHRLQPLSDLHFNADYDNFGQRLAHKPTLYGLSAIAVFILLLGCINFINLSTAQASKRAKEIGIRKTMGSSKKQLILQFLSEAFLLTLIAGILSLALTPLLLKAFTDYIPDSLDLNLIRQPGILWFLLGLVPAVSLFSGFYPALVLSTYKPVIVLKNLVFSNTNKKRSARPRKLLTVFQFTIAQVFIIATILVGKQINYELNKDLGFKKDAIIYFNPNYNEDPTRRFVLLDRLRAIPEIAMISLSNTPPSSNSGGTRIVTYRDGKKEIETDVDKKFVDTNYIKLYQMKLLAGANLPLSDTMQSFMINETYMHALGFKEPQQVIGKYLDWGNGVRYPITAVVADFHQKSLHEPIKPLVLANNTSQEYTFNIALLPQNAGGQVWKTAITKIEKVFKEVYPNDDFEYSFLDESLSKYYTAEQNTSRLLMWATGLAILISCLGLLGLAIYITNLRTKEIGIRKVVGATVTQLILLLSKDLLKPVAIALIIAIPVAWYGANEWLQNFAYRTTLNWWIFFEGGAIIFSIAFIILCGRTFRAAVANPVKSLRTE
jgi:putative ABC transport system permease protein